MCALWSLSPELRGKKETCKTTAFDILKLKEYYDLMMWEATDTVQVLENWLVTDALWFIRQGNTRDDERFLWQGRHAIVCDKRDKIKDVCMVEHKRHIYSSNIAKLAYFTDKLNDTTYYVSHELSQCMPREFEIKC